MTKRTNPPSLAEFVIASIVLSLQPGAFVQTVTDANGLAWDVYRYRFQSLRGHIAVQLDADDFAVIGAISVRGHGATSTPEREVLRRMLLMLDGGVTN
jgi:hypothetical protein